MRQFICGGAGSLATSGDSYFAGNSSRAVAPQSADAAGLRSYAVSSGMIRIGRATVDTAPGSGKSWTVAVLKNGSSVGSGSISDAATTLDLNLDFPIAAGDSLVIKCTAVSTPAATGIRVAGWWDSYALSEQWFASENPANNLTAGTQYSAICGSDAPHGTETSIGLQITPGTYSKIRFHLSIAPGAGQSRTATLMVNGSPSSLAATVSDAALVATGTGSVTIAAGDKVSIQTTISGAPANSRSAFALAFISGTPGRQDWISPNPDANTNTVVRQLPYNADEPSSTTIGFPVQCTVMHDKLFLSRSAAPGAGKAVTVTVYVDESPTAMGATISDTATTGNTTSNPQEISPNQRVVYHVTYTGVPASGILAVSGSVFYPPNSPMIGCAGSSYC